MSRKHINISKQFLNYAQPQAKYTLARKVRALTGMDDIKLP